MCALSPRHVVDNTGVFNFCPTQRIFYYEKENDYVVISHCELTEVVENNSPAFLVHRPDGGSVTENNIEMDRSPRFLGGKAPG